MKAFPTIYRGWKMKSKLEARYGMFLDILREE